MICDGCSICVDRITNKPKAYRCSDCKRREYIVTMAISMGAAICFSVLCLITGAHGIVTALGTMLAGDAAGRHFLAWCEARRLLSEHSED